MKSHVVLILTDQQRADTIAALGNRAIITPALDALARDSLAFDRCYTPSPVCVPARLCLRAGQYCARTGNNNNNAAQVYAGEGFYAAFTRAGFDTCCIGKMHNYPDMYAPLGFSCRLSQEETADEMDTYAAFLRATPYKNVFDYHGQRTELFYVPQVSPLPMEAHPTQWVGDRAVERINGWTPDAPAFLMASFVHPHPPFAPPAPWNKLYRAPVYAPFQPADKLSYEDLLRNRYTLDALGISPREAELLAQHYYACISFVDYQVGRIVAALKARGLYEDTVILFTSDHGEMLGDYRSMGKRTMLDSACRVPFLLKAPGARPARRHDVCSLVDAAPTLLSLCGIPYAPDAYDGVNLLRARHEAVYSQHGFGPSVLYMVAGDRDKLIYSGIGERYFYFDQFPEAHDRYDPANPRVRYLRDLLDAHRASDCCPLAPAPGKRQSPARLAPGSVYPRLDDHVYTRAQEIARMPAGYPVTVSDTPAGHTGLKKKSSAGTPAP